VDSPDLATDQKVGGSSPSERARSAAPSDHGRGRPVARRGRTGCDDRWCDAATGRVSLPARGDPTDSTWLPMLRLPEALTIRSVSTMLPSGGGGEGVTNPLLLQGHAFGAPGRPASAALVQQAGQHPRDRAGRSRGWGLRSPRSPGVSPSWGGSLARCLSVGTHGAGRCRSAVTAHPPPARHPPSRIQSRIPSSSIRGAALLPATLKRVLRNSVASSCW